MSKCPAYDAALMNLPQPKPVRKPITTIVPRKAVAKKPEVKPMVSPATVQIKKDKISSECIECEKPVCTACPVYDAFLALKDD